MSSSQISHSRTRPGRYYSDLTSHDDRDRHVHDHVHSASHAKRYKLKHGYLWPLQTRCRIYLWGANTYLVYPWNNLRQPKTMISKHSGWHIPGISIVSWYATETRKLSINVVKIPDAVANQSLRLASGTVVSCSTWPQTQRFRGFKFTATWLHWVELLAWTRPELRLRLDFTVFFIESNC